MTELSGSLEQSVVIPASKPTVELKSVVEKSKVAEPPKVVEASKPTPRTDPQYRLNIFNASGNIKSSIGSAVYQDMCRRNAEIIRSLSSTKWMTMDEILKAVWILETKMRHPSNRGRISVETAIKELIEREMVSVR